jgi:16S rRNA (guanine527-N7)-methyltransferase
MLRDFLAKYEDHFPKLTDEQHGLLEEHFELLLKWNKVLNLSAVRNEPEIAERHYAESLFLAARLPAGELTIADIGSGGGFPGIPIAAVRRESQVTLIESHQRKAVFLKEATRSFGNVRVLARRVEDVQEQFGWSLSRAVKLEDIAGALGRISANTALLLGSSVQSLPDGWNWEPVARLPWGDHRHLAIGHKVSRETPAAGETACPTT